MNKALIACVLAAMMMAGIVYADENTDGTNKTSTTVRAGRGRARRVTQSDGTVVRGRRGNQDGTEAGSGNGRQKKGRKKAAANLKAMDKNGDGNISKSEATGRIARHFDTIDTDGNSSLSPAELKAMNHHKQKNKVENSQSAGKRKGRAEKRQSPADTSN